MALFLSTIINKIDRKGRISVPAPFRSALSSSSFQGVVVFRSYKHPSLEGWGMERMVKLSESVDHLALFSELQDDFSATLFSDSLALPFDGEGRIFLPPDLLAYAEITDKAAFVGRGATFQIWNPIAFDRHQSEARRRMQDQKGTLILSPPHSP